MKRFRELVQEIRSAHRTDDFFADLDNWLRREPIRKSHYESYDRVFQVLDDDSWAILKRKAIQQFRNERPGQRKEAFFNTLNEAFAYAYLLRSGYEDIRFIKEGKKKSPDIEFVDMGRRKYCEVKTVGITDAEARLRERGGTYNGAAYRALSEPYLGKLAARVREGLAQIHARGNDGIVFLILRFDDFTLDYYGNYRKQLRKFCRRRGFKNLVLKVGHRGNRRMSFFKR